MKIALAQKIYREICNHAISNLPHEACGLLSGQKNDVGKIRVSKYLPSKNISDNPARSFEIDPALVIKTQKQCRSSSDQIIGHYHSHPNGRRGPLKYDMQQNYDNSLIWLIVALIEDRSPEVNAYATTDGQFNEIDLSII